MSSFGCGFEFDKQVSEVFANSSTHARFLLLSKYALVEPNPASKTERGKAIDNPFMMRPAQQLIALRLLGINLSALVSSNPFGFEVLSTHTMKTALAASSAVAWERRKSVKETLEVVGCKIVEGGGTHVDAKAEFEELKNYFVIRHRYSNEVDSLNPGPAMHDVRKATPTMLLPSEMELLKSQNAVSVDKVYEGMLREARPQHDTAFFFPPLTAINYGNSALADGFVTFYMAKNIEEEPVRFTCMNQAKDKLEYDGKPRGSLPMKKIAANAKRCSHGALDFLFGKQRLLFLSSPSEAAGLYARHEAKVTIDRKWIPRAMTNCRLLKDLMKTLAEQRTKAARQGMHNVVVTQNGDLVERDDY